MLNVHVSAHLMLSVKQRPRKLLVLINPISGNSNGKKIYSKQVAGLFRTAHVETDVIGKLSAICQLILHAG